MTDQRSLSVAISGLMPYMYISIFSRSTHIIFGWSLGKVPIIFTLCVLLALSISSLCITCPFHVNRFCIRTKLIGVTFANSADGFILNDVSLGLSVTPSEHFNFGGVCKRCASCLHSAHHSLPIHYRSCDYCIVQCALQPQRYLSKCRTRM